MWRLKSTASWSKRAAAPPAAPAGREIRKDGAGHPGCCPDAEQDEKQERRRDADGARFHGELKIIVVRRVVDQLDVLVSVGGVDVREGPQSRSEQGKVGDDVKTVAPHAHAALIQRHGLHLALQIGEGLVPAGETDEKEQASKQDRQGTSQRGRARAWSTRRTPSHARLPAATLARE